MTEPEISPTTNFGNPEDPSKSPTAWGNDLTLLRANVAELGEDEKLALAAFLSLESTTYAATVKHNSQKNRR